MASSPLNLMLNRNNYSSNEKQTQPRNAKSTSRVNKTQTNSKTTKTIASQARPANKKKSTTTVKAANKSKVENCQEKRLRRYRDHAPKSFSEKLFRAQTQRMVVISRKRTGTRECPAEEIDVVGSTGNIYKVTIGQVTSCTCPDHKKGHECKHKVYALHTVLKAPEHLQYQLGFLTSELVEIFENAPRIPNEEADQDNNHNRKSIDGDCPICYMEMNEKDHTLVWCKAACGNNMHESCFKQYARFQGGGQIRCVLCRMPWESDNGDLETITKSGQIGEDGYINVAEQFGMSGVRDFSGYYRPWVQDRLGMGF